MITRYEAREDVHNRCWYVASVNIKPAIGYWKCPSREAAEAAAALMNGNMQEAGQWVIQWRNRE